MSTLHSEAKYQNPAEDQHSEQVKSISKIKALCLIVKLRDSKTQNNNDERTKILDTLKQVGITETTASAFDQKCNGSRLISSSKSSLIDKMGKEFDLFWEVHPELGLESLYTKTNDRAYYWLIANKAFKSLGFTALSVFGLSSAFIHHTSNMTIHTDIDKFDKTTSIQKIPTYATWTKTVMELMGLAGAGEFITNLNAHSNPLEKDDIAKLSTGKKAAYYIWRAYKKIANALTAVFKVLLAYEIIMIMKNMAIAIAKVSHTMFNITAFSKAGAIKAIAAKIAPFFKFLKPALGFMGFTMIGMLALSALKGFIKTIVTTVRAIKGQVSWKQFAKVAVKTIPKIAAVVGAALILSTPVIGWAIMGVATAILSIWSFSKIFRQKRNKINKEEFIGKQKLALANNKDAIEKTFFDNYKAQLSKSVEPETAALNAKKASLSALKSNKHKNLTNESKIIIKHHIEQLYFQSQKVTGEDSATEITKDSTIKAEEQMRELGLTGGNIYHFNSKPISTLKATEQLHTEMKTKAAFAFLEATRTIAPTVGVAARMQAA